MKLIIKLDKLRLPIPNYYLLCPFKQMYKLQYNIKTAQKLMGFSLTFLIKIATLLHICFAQGYEKNILLQIDEIDRKIQELELQIAIIDAGYVKDYQNNNSHYQQSVASEYARIQTKQDINTKFKKLKYQDLQIIKDMTIHCQIPNAKTYTIFQTPRSSYIIVNAPKTNQFIIYNSECILISHIKNNQVYKILCDRGLCDDGNIIILTHNNTLVACSEISNFSDCNVIHNLNQIIKGRVVGAAVRGRGGGQVQVYVADSEGYIMVFDGQGKMKLTLSIEQDSKISHFADIHPHPIVISSKGWIYNFQINKYSLSLTKCPYLFHPINHIFISHPYSSLIYTMSERAISIIDLKSQSKGCEVTQRFYPIQHIGELAIDEHPHIAEYQGTLYIENKIINLQNATVYELSACANTRFNFQQMKNNYRKGFFTMSCSTSFQQNSTSSLLVFKQINSEQSSSKNNTIIMIIILLLIVLLIFLFLRSTVPNLDYDEELRYSQKIRYRTEVGETLQDSPDVQEAEQTNTNFRPKDVSTQVRSSKEKQQSDQNHQKTLKSRKKD